MYWAESSHALSRRLGSEWLTYFLRLYGVSFRGRFGGLAGAEHHIRAAVAVVIAVFTEESCSDSSRNSGISMSFHVVYSLSVDL